MEVDPWSTTVKVGAPAPPNHIELKDTHWMNLANVLPIDAFLSTIEFKKTLLRIPL